MVVATKTFLQIFSLSSRKRASEIFSCVRAAKYRENCLNILKNSQKQMFYVIFKHFLICYRARISKKISDVRQHDDKEEI